MSRRIPWHLLLTLSVYIEFARGYKYLGCFVDSSNRLLSAHETFSTSMTIESCIETCSDKGHHYAGVEFFVQCFCGEEPSTSPVSDSECNSNCSGNAHQMCGGAWRISVYYGYEVDDPISGGAIAGIICGLFGVIVTVCVVCCCLCHHKKQRQPGVVFQPTTATYPTTTPPIQYQPGFGVTGVTYGGHYNNSFMHPNGAIAPPPPSIYNPSPLQPYKDPHSPPPPYASTIG